MDMRPNSSNKFEIATFAGGCFWCTQHLFDKIEGVVKTEAGYTGGTEETATYAYVSQGNTTHREALQIFFSPDKISYLSLVELFLRNIDPTDPGGQFADQGEQYRTAIFYHSESQKEIATALFQEILLMGQIPCIYTELLPAEPFYPAEQYHQHYAEKNSQRYQQYYQACGRPQKLKRLWELES